MDEEITVEITQEDVEKTLGQQSFALLKMSKTIEAQNKVIEALRKRGENGAKPEVVEVEA